MQSNRVPWWLKAVTFLMIGLCAVAAFALFGGIYTTRKMHRERMERLEREGYARVKGDQLVVSNRTTAKTWYEAGSVRIMDGADASVAMYCATGELRGTVKGDVLFVGRTLFVEPGTVIEGHLETTCWLLQNMGTVRDGLRGTKYYFLTNRAPAHAKI
jgi:hypothetical protein